MTQTHLGITLPVWGFDTLDVIYTTPEATLLSHHHLSVALSASGSDAAQGALKPARPIAYLPSRP